MKSVEKGKSQFEQLAEQVNKQIITQVPRRNLIKSAYGKAIGNISSKFRSLYEDFEALAHKPYCIFGCKGYGYSVVFSSKNGQPLKAEVNVRDFGTNYQCDCLKLVQEAPSIEISKMSRLGKDTRVFFGSKLEQINVGRAKEIIDDAIESVGDIGTESETTFGVPMSKDRRYRIPMSQEEIVDLTLRFVRGDWELQKELQERVRRHFNS